MDIVLIALAPVLIGFLAQRGDLDQPGAWPISVRVAQPAMRGRMRDVTPGDDEGQLCLRLDGRGKPCLGSLEYLPDSALGGCTCFTMRMPPCSYCVSTMPECPECGWRMED